MKREYHKSIFAFIDLLGAKETIENDDGTFLNHLGQTYDSTLNIYKLVCSSCVRDRIKTKIFSDNIVFECVVIDETDYFAEFREMVFLVSIFQEELLRKNILCRGAITIGDVYLDDVLVFGRALSEAYLLESEKAIYPRVIISKKLADFVYPKTSDEDCLKYMCVLDDDNEYFIDYLHSAGKSNAERIENIKKAIMHNEAKLNRPDLVSCVKTKLLWHEKYLKAKLKLYSK